MARIISIVNQKGGTGKSACAANLGAGLARKNKKCQSWMQIHSQMYQQVLDIVIVMIVIRR